uniref:RNase H type-1 domain-containing protein n=1 Tax=Cannabis sativa TaxID=3483 RepID=A0A803QG24_CANSA
MGHKLVANNAKGKRPVIDNNDFDFAPPMAKGGRRPMKKRSKLLDVDNNFEHWTKPADNTIKINVDGATFETENAYGYGIVACDSEGNVIDFVAKYFYGSFSAEVVEALEVKEALSWLKDKGWNMVEVETDSLLTVQEIFNQQQMTSVFGLITHDCKSFLSSLSNVSLRFVKRSANKVAHYVARRSCFYPDRSIHDVNVLADYNANL